MEHRLRHFTGKLFILVGPAGSGKNTLMKAALDAIPELKQVPTATTRAMRATEQEGREHFFVTHPEFEGMIQRGELLEYQLVHGGNYYGMTREPIEAGLANGTLLIADIEYLGAQAARAAYPDQVITIFITPPSITDLINRLTNRGENFAEIAKRLLRAPRELAYASECDYIILNADQETAAQQLIDVILAEAHGKRAAVERPHQLSLQLAAQVLVTSGDFILQPLVGSAPFVLLNNDEPPHQTAQRMLGDLFGDAARTLNYPVSELALSDLQTQGHSNDEILVYVYAVNLPEKLVPPDGWTWISTETQFA